MLTLQLPPDKMRQLEQASKQAGMTVSEYALSKLFNEPISHIDNGAMPNPMIERSLSINNPSALGDGVSIQRELRNEWD